MVEKASNEERDRVFAELFLQPENRICFDCQASNANWASVNNAVFLCFQCTSNHRKFEVKTSFIRSCVFDGWTSKQLEVMKHGGNKVAKSYFEKHDLIQTGKCDYANPLAAKYRAELQKKAEASFKSLEKSSIPIEDKKAEEKVSLSVPKPMPVVVTKESIEPALIATSVSSKYYKK